LALQSCFGPLYNFLRLVQDKAKSHSCHRKVQKIWFDYAPCFWLDDCIEHQKWCSTCDLTKISLSSMFSYLHFSNPTNETKIQTAPIIIMPLGLLVCISFFPTHESEEMDCRECETIEFWSLGPIIVIGQWETIISYYRCSCTALVNMCMFASPKKIHGVS